METRYINELARSLSLSYGYNLAGEVTSLTDPFGAIVNYSYDAAGQLVSVATMHLLDHSMPQIIQANEEWQLCYE
ncbi:MAG TPA: RHS repeat domain-containing protein [Blastocatellia bacterium]|nr:RHS repeat domain-containing protein [Blastocatellia bacterium]